MNKEVNLLRELENKKFSKNNMPAIIISVILVFVMLLASLWLVFAFVFPARLGRFVYNINWNTYALKLYERDYEKTKDINSLYMSLNISIKIENDSKVVKLFEIFENSSEYESFINSVNETNLKTEAKPIIKSTLLNEDNYLKNQYIKSLIKTDNLEKAIKYALSSPLKADPTYDNLGNYMLNNFCNLDVLNKKVNSGYVHDLFRDIIWDDETLYTNMYNYMNNINTEFWKCFDVENYPEYASVSPTYIYAMGNRILQVGSNVLTVLGVLEVEEENGVNLVNTTVSIMNQINEQYKYL